MIMSTALWRPSVVEPLQRLYCGPSWEKQVCGDVTASWRGQSLIRCSRAGGPFLVDRVANGCSFGKRELRSWKFAAVVAAVAEGREQAQMDQDREQEVERAKMDLLRAVMDTKRGAQVTPDQRAAIEETMVGVEKFNAGIPLVLDQLHGTWLLQYTTAPDVISLLQAANLPFLQVGQVYQNFDCKGRTDGGTVENIVRWSVPGLLQENEGATLIVTAKFSVASPRSIVLKFEEARVAEVEISAELESFIAPALLPRTFINLQTADVEHAFIPVKILMTKRYSRTPMAAIALEFYKVLQFLRSFDLRFPLRGSQTQPENATRAPIGAWYNLTFLDNNLLLGRALGTGGVFVFSRTQARRKSI